MLSPHSVQPCCALRAEEHCEAAGRRCITIQQDRMQFRQLNAYAAECNSVSLWIMNIHLSRSFFTCFFFLPHSSVFWILMSWACKSDSVVFSRTCLVFQLPADSSLSNPPWPIYKLHVRQHAAFPKQTAHRAFLMLSALVGSLLQHWLWRTIITAKLLHAPHVSNFVILSCFQIYSH